MAYHLSIRFLLFTLVLLSAKWAVAQLQLANTVHDFGTLTRADVRYADFAIHNVGSKPEVLFRVEVPKGVEVKMSAKTIAPGTTETIRLHYNPQMAGPFRLEAKVFASAWMEPRSLRLSGESTFAETGVPCPDFGSDPAGLTRLFHVSLRDANMRPVAGAEVRLYRDGRLATATRSDANGELSTELPPARYLLSARLGTAEADTVIYASALRDHVLLVLPEALPQPSPPALEEPLASADFPDDSGVRKEKESKPAPPATPKPAPTSEPNAEPEPEIVLDLPSRQKPKSEKRPPANPANPAPAGRPAGPIPGDNPLMPLAEYKQSNVVFLVDVSTSMKHQGRLDLLKIAMTDLLQVLRDVDRFTLISYASDTELLLGASQNLNREEVAAAIAALEARGSTEGAKAIDFAGKEALKHFLPEGHNTLYLATDGAFNAGAVLATKLVRKYRKRGVETSVLCIRCGKYTTEEMSALAEEGAGRFVPISSPADAGEALIEVLKQGAVHR